MAKFLSPPFFRCRPAVALTLAGLLALCLPGCGRRAQRPANALSGPDRAALAQYELIRAALTNDDLRAAQKAARQLADSLKPATAQAVAPEMYQPADALANSIALDRAREQFRALSVSAIHQAGDVEGFYVFSSPMYPDSQWLQTKPPPPDNPYMGRVMRTMGEQVK